MAAIQELEVLLARATPSVLEAEVVQGKVIPVAEISRGIGLVYGVFPYQRRAIGVEGRALTYELTRQPILAVEERGQITPLPYAEDIIGHPLSRRLAGVLEAVSLR